MNRKVIKIIILAIIMLLTVYLPNSFASGATISTSTASVKPGETVELYIDLSTASIGYDINISVNDSSLIESSEVVSKIGEGNSSRIYLVQLAAASERTVYPVGTRIAKIKYKIASNAPADSQITFTVTGEVAGETSQDRNTINETASVTVVSSSTGNDDNDGQSSNNNNNGSNNNNNEQENAQESTQNTQTTTDEDETVAKTEIPALTENTTAEKDTTTAKGRIPKAGAGVVMVLAIIAIIAFGVTRIVKYKDLNDI